MKRETVKDGITEKPVKGSGWVIILKSLLQQHQKRVLKAKHWPTKFGGQISTVYNNCLDKIVHFKPEPQSLVAYGCVRSINYIRSRSYQTFIFLVFRFLLLSLRVCSIWKICVYCTTAKLRSKKNEKFFVYKAKKFGRIASWWSFYLITRMLRLVSRLR